MTDIYRTKFPRAANYPAGSGLTFSGSDCRQRNQENHVFHAWLHRWVLPSPDGDVVQSAILQLCNRWCFRCCCTHCCTMGEFRRILLVWLFVQGAVQKRVKYRSSKGCATTASPINVDCARLEEPKSCRHKPAGWIFFWSNILTHHFSAASLMPVLLYGIIFSIKLHFNGETKRSFHPFWEGNRRGHTIRFWRENQETIYSIFRGKMKGYYPRFSRANQAVVYTDSKGKSSVVYPSFWWKKDI